MQTSKCSDVQNFLTNQDGKVTMELPLNKACDFAAEKLGYQPNSIRLSRNQMPGKTIFVQIPLKMECIFIVSGIVLDGLAETPVDSALVRLQSYCSGEQDEMSMYTDADGRYEFRDVREDCDIRVTVAKPGFTRGSVTFKTGSECGEAARVANVIDDILGLAKGFNIVSRQKTEERERERETVMFSHRQQYTYIDGIARPVALHQYQLSTHARTYTHRHSRTLEMAANGGAA